MAMADKNNIDDRSIGRIFYDWRRRQFGAKSLIIVVESLSIVCAGRRWRLALVRPAAIYESCVLDRKKADFER